MLFLLAACTTPYEGPLLVVDEPVREEISASAAIGGVRSAAVETASYNLINPSDASVYLEGMGTMTEDEAFDFWTQNTDDSAEDGPYARPADFEPLILAPGESFTTSAYILLDEEAVDPGEYALELSYLVWPCEGPAEACAQPADVVSTKIAVGLTLTE